MLKMEETKDKSQVKIENKPKKKNKNKEKKRLMSLFRGPKTEHKLYRKLTDEESSAFRQTFVAIMEKNPSLKLHRNKTTKDRKSTANRPENDDSSKSLTNELQFGLNSIIRSIEKKSIIGVILTNPLALQLEDTILELCSNNEVPCLSVKSLDELSPSLNISSLSAIAFKPNITSTDSVFNKLYANFKQLVDTNCVPIELNEERDSKSETNKIVKQDIDLRTTEDSIDHKNGLSIDSLFKELYTKESDDNYSHLMDAFTKPSKPNEDQLESQHSLIKLFSADHIHFPRTQSFNGHIPEFQIIFNQEKQVESNDDMFAQSLIEESLNKGIKRKSENKNFKESVVFKNPRIERIEPSMQKIQSRKQRKLRKKQKKK